MKRRKLEALPMNVIDRPGSIVGELIGEPCWAEVIAAIEKADDLGPDQKRHWPTALRQMGRYSIGRSP